MVRVSGEQSSRLDAVVTGLGYRSMAPDASEGFCAHFLYVFLGDN